MLESKEWLQHAKTLSEGGSKKIAHDCGPGDCLHINNKREGWAAYCHRCAYKGWVPRPAESLTEKLSRLARVKAAEDAVAVSPTLPLPAEYDPRAWPLDARVWLYKAGISNAEIAALGIYWNPRMSRVVIPVRNDSDMVVYWQARTLDNTNPKKYLNPRVDKRQLVARYGEGAVIVLTEDILSAYRVSRAGASGWCLLGTKITDHIATLLIRSGKAVTVWLDPDRAGQTNAVQILKQLRAYGIVARNVISSRDPKLLQREEIEWMLSKQSA